MPNFNKMCFHKGASKEVMMGQKTGDYMCSDDCGTPINSVAHNRPTEADWADARTTAIQNAFGKVYEGATDADAVTIDSNYVHPDGSEFVFDSVVMPMNFPTFKKRADDIVKEAQRIGWDAKVETGDITNDPRKVLKIVIKKKP